LGIGAVIKLSFCKEAWHSPAIFAAETATFPLSWRPPYRSWQVGKGASLPHNAQFMWCQDLAIASRGVYTN
jgi:hypothetical protein